MIYLLFINSIFSSFLLISIISLIFYPIIHIFISKIQKIIIKIIYINLSFFILNVLYLHLFHKNFNLDYKELCNKKIIIYNTNCQKYDCVLINYNYLSIFGIKYFLYLNILKNNNVRFTLTIDKYKKIKKNRIYYDTLMFDLVNKYSKDFNKLDFYIINHIKDFLY